MAKDTRKHLVLDADIVEACKQYAETLGLKKWQDGARVLLVQGLRKEGVYK